MAQWGNAASKTLYGGKSESRPGTVVTTAGSSTTTIGAAIYASQTPGTPVGPLNIIGINSTGNILVNSGSGFVQVGGISVIELYYASNHTCYQENSSLNWYGPVDASTTGTQVTNPIPLINSITATPVSNSPGSYPSTGVEVATLAASVSGINYATFNGAFSIAAGSASGFSINNSVSPPQILTNGVGAAGSYNLNITATQTGTAAGVAVPPYTTPSPISVQVGASALVEVALGIHLGNTLAEGAGTFSSISGHWNAVKTGLGRTPTMLEVNFMNAYNYFMAPPSTWPSGDIGSWTTGNGIPVDGSVVPFFQGFFTNGETSNVDFADIIAGTFDADLTNALDTWLGVAPFKKMVIRFNQEFNTSTFPDWNAPLFSSIANWVAAWKHWANVLHTWGNSNGVNVRVVWCPDTSYSQQTSSAPSPVIDYFPAPDGSAVNGRYIDAIGADNYMKGYGVNSNFGQTTTPLSSCTVWSLGTFVAMCQAYNCNLALSETGDGPGADNNNSWSDGSMLNWVNYLNTLSSLTPPVAIEYVALYDVTSGVADQCTGTGPGYPNMVSAWQACIGSGGGFSGIPKIMTVTPS
jgi:hypothetical protein